MMLSLAIRLKTMSAIRPSFGEKQTAKNENVSEEVLKRGRTSLAGHSVLNEKTISVHLSFV